MKTSHDITTHGRLDREGLERLVAQAHRGDPDVGEVRFFAFTNSSEPYAVFHRQGQRWVKKQAVA